MLSVLLTGYEILRTVTESLTPKLMLAANLVKLFGVILSMIMDGLVTGTALNAWSDGTLVIHSLLMYEEAPLCVNLACTILTPFLFSLSILALGSYASWKWKRLAEYDDYHLPGNVKPFGYKSDLKGRGIHSHTRVLSDDLDWDPDLEYGNTVEVTSVSSPALMAPSPGEPSASYTAAAAATTTTTTRERGSSFTKLAGRMHFSLTNDVDETNASAQRSRATAPTETAYDPVSQQMAAAEDPAEPEIVLPKRPRAASYISITGTGSDRRASYNHTRDTSYEEYVRQQKGKWRNSQQRLSQGSEASFSSSSGGAAETTTPPTTAPASRTPSDSAAAYRLSLNFKNEVDDALSAEFGWGSASRSSSMDSEMASGQPPAIAVSGGAVSNAKNVRDSLGRAPSDGSERVAVEAVSETSEEGADDDVKRTRENRDEASRALLGGNRRDDVDHPELLRPGRPKSEAIAFVVTPPPKSPTLGASSRLTWGSAYSRS